MNKDEALVIIIPGFPENEEDTACLPTQQVFVKELNRLFPLLRAIIISIQYPKIRSEYLWYNNPIISMNIKSGKRYKLFNWLRLWRILNKINKEYRIKGILNIWCTEFSVLAKYYSKLHKIKSLVWIQGQDARKGNKFVRFLKPKANELITISDFLTDEFNKNYGVKPAYLIPNGIDESMYSKESVARDIDVLGVGSLIPLKQYHIFLDVVKLMKTKLPGIQSIICGEGAEEERLKRQVVDLGLQNHVSIIGKVAEHTSIYKMMQRAKVFLHTSSYEGFGTVCLEALYAGAQVISFHKPMNTAIKNWHIVKTKEEMAEKAISIINNKETVYEPVRFHTMDDTAKEIMKLFN